MSCRVPPRSAPRSSSPWSGGLVVLLAFSSACTSFTKSDSLDGDVADAGLDGDVGALPFDGGVDAGDDACVVTGFVEIQTNGRLTPEFSLTTRDYELHFPFTQRAAELRLVDNCDQVLSPTLLGMESIATPFTPIDGATAELEGYTITLVVDAPVQVERTVPDPSLQFSQFARELAINGTELVVGAPLEPTDGMGAYDAPRVMPMDPWWRTGAVHTYQILDGDLLSDRYLKEAEGNNGIEFGHTVNVGADFLAVSAFQYNRQGEVYGEVEVFERGVDGWVSSGAIRPPIVYTSRLEAVAVDGANVMVARSGGTENPHIAVYTRESDVWVADDARAIFSPGGINDEGFAASFALQGDTLIVEHRMPDTPILHYYAREPAGWIHQAQVFAPAFRIATDEASVAVIGPQGLQMFRLADESITAEPPVLYPVEELSTRTFAAPRIVLMGERMVLGLPAARDNAGRVVAFARSFADGTFQWKEFELVPAAIAGVEMNEAGFGAAVVMSPDGLVIGSPCEGLNCSGAVRLFY